MMRGECLLMTMMAAGVRPPTTPRCPRSYHLACAHAAGCRFNPDEYTLACPHHASRCPPPIWTTTIGDTIVAESDGPRGGGGAVRASPTLDGRRTRNGRTEGKRKIADVDADVSVPRGGGGRHNEAAPYSVIAAVAAAAKRRKRKEREHISDDEEAFQKREQRRLAKDKSKISCVIVGGSGGGGGFGGDGGLPGAWETLAGVGEEIRALKEIALLPLVYPEAFAALGVAPGRGILLHGPPGTGKTAAVRALVGAAARGPRPVTFFNRRGADCLGKYMGEAERSLRLLFQEAERRQPSIIFFDEIDGLAPSRGSGSGSGDAHEQIHGSVVATLLALMDGLSPRGAVVVVAATNRPDAVDPALRRPGRFDREVHFALPGPAARRDILRLHTREWRPRPSEEIIAAVVARTEGAAGADLRAVATAALLAALRRVKPRLLALDATRECLAAELEAMLPPPPRYAELTAAAAAAAAAGHAGAKLAVLEANAIGARLEVFWSGNDAFFAGTVSAFNRATMEHRVTYDDGEIQWLRLWRDGEVIRVLRLPEDPDPEGVGGGKEEREEDRDREAEAEAPAEGGSDALQLVEEPELDPQPSRPAEPEELAPEEDPNPIMVVCKNKTGMYHPSVRMVRCLCTPCEAATRSGRHSVSFQEPQRWEAHSGMASAKKWKSSIRVVLNQGRGFLGGVGYHTITLGQWFNMELAGMSKAQAMAAAATRGNKRGQLQSSLPPEEPEEPFDAEAAAAAAHALRKTYAAASEHSGLHVTAKDWATALRSATGPCARRSAVGSSLFLARAPLPRHLAPVLSTPLVQILTVLKKAGAPLETAVAGAITASGGGAKGDPETMLEAARILDGSISIENRTSGNFPATAAREDDEQEDGEATWDENALEQDAWAVAAAMGMNGQRCCPPVRVLVCGDGEQGQRSVLMATLHALQGVPTFTVSLPSLIVEGGGDPALGIVRVLTEPLRQVTRTPCVLHLSRIEAWALASAELPSEWTKEPETDISEEETDVGVAPSHLWDLFEQHLSGHIATVSSEASAGLIIIATTHLSTSALPPRVLRFFQLMPDVDVDEGDYGQTVIDLTPPSAEVRAAILTRGAAQIVQVSVAPVLKAAGVRGTRVSAAATKAGVEAAAATMEETTAAELQRLRAENDAKAEREAKAAAVSILAIAAKKARTEVTKGLRATATGLVRTRRFDPALRLHPPAAAVLVAAADGAFSSPATFLAALRCSLAPLLPSRFTRGGEDRQREVRHAVLHAYGEEDSPGPAGAAAAAALDVAESWCHHLRPVVAAAERAEVECAAARAALDKITPVLPETHIHRWPRREGRPGTTTSPRLLPALESHEASFPLPDTHVNPRPPGTRERVAEEVSAEDIEATAAALASTLVQGTDRDGGISVGAMEGLLGTCAGILTRAARQAQAPGSGLMSIFAATREDIDAACRSCVTDHPPSLVPT